MKVNGVGLLEGARFSSIKAVMVSFRSCVLRTPDPEFVAEDKNDVEITDLDSPAKTGKVLGKFPIWSQIPSFRARTWMSMAIITCIVLLFFTIQVNAPHVPKAAKLNVQPAQVNYPVSLSVVDGICYTNAPNGVVSAIRISDGVLLWRHLSEATGEESATVVDGIIYLTPILTIDSHITTLTVQAIRARDGSSLWSRTFQTDSPGTFQLTVMSKVVYIWSSAGRIDALRARDGSLLWHYTSRVPFVSLPTVADGVVYTSAQDGQFTALRASNGIPLWKYTSLNPSQPSPAIVAEGMIFLSQQDGGMDVLRADTGNLLWRYIPQVPAQSLYPQILVSDGVVYAGTHDGYLYALRASDGFTIWSVTLHTNDNLIPMNVAGSVVFVEGSLSGSVNALREGSGSVIWQYPGRAGESVPIMVVQGVVYLASYAASGMNIFASITALRASDGVELWSYTPQTSYKQLLPELGNDIVLIALQDGNVDALNAGNGSLFWQSA